MADFPDDIFTEPEDVDPHGLNNLGPLRRLAGTWEGLRGVDIAPKAEGPDQRDYLERIVMEPIDPQANGPQLLYGLRYHVHINTPDEAITFHDQVGYWLWEPATGLVMQTIAIPRGQVVLASGRADGDRLVVSAKRGETSYGICSTDFLEYAFRTESYTIEVTFNPDGTWSYLQDTMLTVKGQEGLFAHRDRNTLHRIAEPHPNPLALLEG